MEVQKKTNKGLTEHLLYVSLLWDAPAPLAVVTFILASEEDHSKLLDVTEVRNGTRSCGLTKGSDLHLGLNSGREQPQHFSTLQQGNGANKISGHSSPSSTKGK